ncbi:hypothetical protein H2198_005502 [Neophaeococcomyces mojaviensis]|uniref:Uncharacterized protein n=1 Tax=Neophaeococcomyces mojaviensis TaxID=3383035 RepID=A0ACC3A5K5_9EURO|nr:hypothetical protein H2198_005502 [Knufia sp. JES_112]
MHATKCDDEDEPNNFDVDHVPECLRQYLITVREPCDIYKSVNRSHDQRLRLLLRRFTNQIQHGCKNPHCNVPTCLSYRKRNAGGPVRPYTDVAARALAVKCVERCASSESLDEVLKRKKGRRTQTPGNARGASGSGLCWNEPVVPWYSHSEEHLRRRRVASEQAVYHQNGTPTKPSVNRTHLEANGHVKSPKSVAELFTVTGPRSGTGPNIDGRGEAQHSTNDQYDSKGEMTLEQGLGRTRRKSLEYVNGSVPELLIAPHRIVQSKKDPASLSQFMFDDPHVRTLEDTPEHEPGFFKSGKHSQGALRPASPRIRTPSQYYPHTQNDASEDGDQHDRQRREQFDAPTPCTTFRLLPASAVLWLKSLVLKHKTEESSLLQPGEHEGMLPLVASLEALIEQSLYFTFSDPYRLILSAATWDSYALPDVWNIRGEAIRDISQTEFELCHSRKVCLIPMWRSLGLLCRDILWLLHAIQHRRNHYDDNATASHIIQYMVTALRRCYYCPPFTKSEPPYIAKYRSNAQVAHLLVLVLNIALGLYQGSSNASYSEAYSAADYASDNWGSHTLLRIEHLSEAPDPTLSQISISMADLISHRIAVDVARKAQSPGLGKPDEERDIVTCIISILCNPPMSIDPASAQLNCHSRFLELMQAVIHAEWDRVPFVQRTGPVWGALEVLRGMHKCRHTLKLTNDKFEIPSVGTALDEVAMPYEWLSHQPGDHTTHILNYPFLFAPTQIVKYFRSLNLQIMKRSHEKAMGVYNHGKHQLVRSTWRVNGLVEVLDKIRIHMAKYFVMTISRDRSLEDAIGQIWRRERQELLRPLKVRLGKGEGEEGLDHGGVQQEFFRLIFAEAFDPKYGMFDTDSTTHVTWFKPSSLEPLYKFEALGVLLGLAIFNGVTVPITMPLAFYMKILGLEVKAIADIEDGWPELAKSFTIMLDWQNGDVGDVIARTYEFTYEAFGEMISINMSKTNQQPDSLGGYKSLKGKERASPLDGRISEPRTNPNTSETDLTNAHLTNGTTSDHYKSSEVEEAPLVTNDNREAFVSDYIDHLINITIQPQFSAFLRGLQTIISPRSLSLFSHSPSTLKLLVEGHPLSQLLDLTAWSAATTYEDYEPSDPIVIWFWKILMEDFTQGQLRRLLEFVTASDRIPVNGWKGVTFIVQRNGEGDERLPGSSTCYGRLLLPNYSSKEVLKEKLEKAVENSLGFGAL